MWLSALVGAAAAWPLLILSAIWPRLAAVALTFAYLPPWVPSWLVRGVWIGLAIVVPFALGAVVASRARGPAVPIPGTRRVTAPPPSSATRRSPVREPKVVRLLRGIPITLAIAASFLIVFVTVPLRRFLSILRRQVEIDVPLVTDAHGYRFVADEIADTLARHGMEARPVEPAWTVTAPSWRRSPMLRRTRPSIPPRRTSSDRSAACGRRSARIQPRMSARRLSIH